MSPNPATVTTDGSNWLSVGSLTRTLGDLVRINSVNPAHGGPEGGEARVIDYLEGVLRELGIPTERWDAKPGRPNLSAVLPGRDPSRTILYNSHVDTVSVEGMTIDPFDGGVREGRLHGRGSTDAKGQVTALLHAFAAAARSPEAPPTSLRLVFTVDEEAGFGGIQSLVDRGIEAEAAVVGEPTELKIVVAHKGTQRWHVELEGRAAHSAKPHLGVNAIHHAAILIRKISEDYARDIARNVHPLLGPPTVNVSVISGGTQVNLVPARARILLDRRTVPGETRAAVEAEFEAIFAAIRAERPEFSARQEPPLMVHPPLETDPAHPIVKAASAITSAMGNPGEPEGVPYGTDGSNISEAGVPTIIVGPGTIDQAHTADEFIRIADLEAGARFYHRLMMTGPGAAVSD